MGKMILNGKEYTSSPKDGFPPIIYSDEEREIGVWRDGKPLYQKTVYHNQNIPANSNNYEITCGLSNVDKIVKIDLVGINGDAFYVLPMHVYTSHYQSPEFSLNVQSYNKSTDKLRMDFGSSRGLSGGVIITLQYTKTTDTAGSGKYTTYGGIAHHYSTSEQVVGTWIDGKPLYEKTVHKTFTEMDWNGDRKIFQAHPSGSKIRHIEAIAYSSAWGMSFGMGEHNFAGSESSSSYLYLGMFYQNVCMGYTGSRSDFTSASPEVYCTVQYTKNSD